MDRDDVIALLRQRAPELKAVGVVSASLFGSTARGEAYPGDVDIAVRLNDRFSTGGLDYFWQRQQLRETLAKLLGCEVTWWRSPSASRTSSKR